MATSTDHPSLQNLNISGPLNPGNYGAPSGSTSMAMTNGAYLGMMQNKQQQRNQMQQQPNTPTPGSGPASHNNEASSSSNHSPSLSPKSSPLHSSNDTLNSSASVSSGVGSQNSSVVLPSSPGSNISLADYLSQLIKDKKQLAGFPHVFYHAERLLDEEINKVRLNLFHVNGGVKDPLVLPEVQGSTVTLTEKVYVPVEEHPDFNFVGRILGPRGLTAKQLEKETQCKIMIRGKGSMRDKQKEAQNKGKPNWEHLNDNLHVLITVDDTPERARIKLNRAVEEIKKLLVPMNESDDELKKRQLMELAIINGTYRDNSPKPHTATPATLNPIISQYYVDHAARLQLLANFQRQQQLGAPLMRQNVNNSGSSPTYYHTSAGSPSPFVTPDQLSAAGLLINPYEYATAYNPALAASTLLNGEYQLDHLGAVGGFMPR